MQMMIKMSVCDLHLCVIGNKAWQHSNVGEVLVLRKIRKEAKNSAMTIKAELHNLGAAPPIF